VTLESLREYGRTGIEPPSMERAGPREYLYFDPSKVKAAIVTCGGLCPGINDVIRSLVMCLHYNYGVKNILGIRYGFQGLIPEYGHPTLDLEPRMVDDIHEKGGSILSSSRGNQDIGEIVDALERMNISILFCIGGDGTLKAAQRIAHEIDTRGVKIAVVGIPKTIDNDLCYMEKTFGFETAFTIGIDAIRSAHLESKGAPNGIGLVKIMGRHSGYLAANAALALNDANFVLIPEVPFDLDGPNGFLHHLSSRLKDRHHAVILVAEGAGQEFFEKDDEYDASGNVKLHDIGLYLKDQINRYFMDTETEVNLKYIDPSYLIRSTPANANDSIFCSLLSTNAVHAAMAGKTGLVVGKWNNTFVHVPIKTVISRRNRVSTDSVLWQNVLEATGQPKSMVNSSPS
jgi:6-phosphofructokinase 1